MSFVFQVARSEQGDQEQDNGDYLGNDGVKFQTEWLPVEGTVPEFFTHLTRSLEAYAPHQYELKLSNRVYKCAERAFLVEPLINDACPEEFKHVVTEVFDFSSDIHAKREHDLTCTFPETHKCEVHHLTFNPKFVSVDEIERHHPRSARFLRQRNIVRVLRPENVVVYCFSKEKASAAYNQQATTYIISIVRHGKLPDNSRCEAFLDRKRIPGGDRTGFPCLPNDKLCDVDRMSPLHEMAKRYRRSRDGCTAQYQGKAAFRGFQTMNARHNGLENEDMRKRPHHGKDIADGDTAAAGGMVASSFHDDYGGGTQNLVRHLAFKYPCPNIERRTRYYGARGLYATTRYIWMFLPQDAIDDSVVAVDEGYSGSSKDYYYRSVGATIEASRLMRRERICGCRPCLRLQDACLMTPSSLQLQTAKTPRATSVVL